MPAIGRLSAVAIDCPDPLALATFYAAVLDLRVRECDDDEGNEWIELDNGTGITVAFQRVDEYVAPQWPGSEHPQHAHLDIDVADLEQGELHVLALGATKATYQPGTTFRVFLDPAGHPFCLVLDPAVR